MAIKRSCHCLICSQAVENDDSYCASCQYERFLRKMRWIERFRAAGIVKPNFEEWFETNDILHITRMKVQESGVENALHILTEDDILFLSRHLCGCNASELARHLGIAHSIIRGYLKSGSILAKKVELAWLISFDEIVHALYAASDKWILMSEAAREAGYNYTTLYNYYCQGAFHSDNGEPVFCIKDLGGRIVLRRDQYRARCREIVEQKRQNVRRWNLDLLSEDEVTGPLIANIIKISSNVVKSWRKNGYLPFRMQGRVPIYRLEDVYSCIAKMLAGEIVLRSPLREKLHQFMEQ